MQVKVKFFAVDVQLGFSNCSFDLPEGITVEDVLNECLKLPQINIEESDFKTSMVLLNGIRTEIDAQVKEGDVVTVLRPLGGG